MEDYIQKIPPAIKTSLDLYVEKGRSTGHFLKAVLSNNLTGAVGHGDENSMAALKHIVMYMYNEMPASCWGDSTAVKNWIANGGREDEEE